LLVCSLLYLSANEGKAMKGKEGKERKDEAGCYIVMI
jgi:hypothetical protein